jgi:Ca2+-binding RTX toxin-like protein
MAIINGTPGNDNLLGTIAPDQINGLAGNDTLSGGLGNDTLNGGLGIDLVVASVSGDDNLFVTNTRLTTTLAADGTDTLNSIERVAITGGDGANSMFANGFSSTEGPFNGSVNFNGGAGVDFLIGGNGNDTLDGGTGNDILIGGNGNDLINGGNNNDRLEGQGGNDTLNGGSGIDLVKVNATDSNIVLTNTSVTGNGVDTLNGIETAELFANNTHKNIDASSFTLGSVTLDGSSLDNILRGGSGNDSLDGEGSNDTLNGGGGDDILNGGAGNDLLIDGGGFDQFFFGTGRAFVSSDLGIDTISSLDIGSDKIVLSKTTFTALESAVGGSLFASDFESVDSVGDIQFNVHEIVYHRGLLIYNENGAAGGLGTGGVIADLVGDPNISAADFQIVV